MKQFTVTYRKTISEEDLRDLIIDGIECGICEWALLHNDEEQFTERRKADKEKCTSEIVADIIIEGGSVLITDKYEDEEAKFRLTLERLLKGIEKNAKERPFDCDLEDYDSTTADCIFQYAIFDDVIFG